MKYKCLNCGVDFLIPAVLHRSTATPNVSVDVPSCPSCLDWKFDVAPEEDITSVKSVPLEEVDGWLAQGYKVRELYAKTATLVKCESTEKKTPEEEVDLMRSAIHMLQQEEKQA